MFHLADDQHSADSGIRIPLPGEKLCSLSGRNVVLPWVPEDILFLSIQILRGKSASTRREAQREDNERREKQKSVSGALSNRKHGLFHLRYFKNGLLEQGKRSLTISHVVRDTGIYICLALFVDLSMPWKKFLLHDRRCKWTCLRKQ